MEQKPKIVFFDMEGTLFKPTTYRADGSLSPSLWTMIEERLGEDVKKRTYDNATRVAEPRTASV